MSDSEIDWFLREWMHHYGKRQAALVNELGWSKAKASDVWHGRQRFNRDLVAEVTQWLTIQPFELLMRPSEALALRQLRTSAREIAGFSADDQELQASAGGKRR